MIRHLPLALLLLLQAALLYYRLDLLPVWTDELFTLETVAHPVGEITEIVSRDIHPPLYYVLLHAWQQLPTPWTGIARMRAFSALWALLATLLLDWLWTRRLSPLTRWTALGLFAFSPCLLLYGRMARSYSMQAALVLIALGLMHRWMREPERWRIGAGALAAAMALLYTHYAPGIAVMAGFALAGWRRIGPVRMVAFALATAIGYLPWLVEFAGAMRRWGEAPSFSASYAISGSRVLEHGVKLGYGVLSLTIGETFHVLSVLLTPLLLWLAAKGLRAAEWPLRPTALIGIAAVAGYAGVSRWVSYPFIPARLLWLLPFLCIAVSLGLSQWRAALRTVALFLILTSYATSAVSYFERSNFVNLGYNAPLAEIAAMLNKEMHPDDLLLIDGYNTDGLVLIRQLTGPPRYVLLDRAARVEEARLRMRDAATVWMVRTTRDISPAQSTSMLEREACEGKVRRARLLEPLAQWQTRAIQLAGWPTPITHFYQVTVCSTK